MVKPLVDDPAPYSTGLINPNDALLPIGPEVYAPYEPFITVSLNGLPMRFRASGLRPALLRGVTQMLAMLYDENPNQPMSGKMKAAILVMKQAIGLMLPLMPPMVALVKADPRVSAHVKRMLPDMPRVPRHADRIAFLLTYLAEVLHAALTENAWELDVEPDAPDDSRDDSRDDSVVRVVRFAITDPSEEP